MKLKVGVAGLRRGVSYVKVFNHHPKTEVVAVCDAARERAEAVARENGVPQAFDDYEAFLRHGFDVAVIATPAPLHAEHVIAALEHGKHVLSEVPGANAADGTSPRATSRTSPTCATWSFFPSTPPTPAPRRRPAWADMGRRSTS